MSFGRVEQDLKAVINARIKTFLQSLIPVELQHVGQIRYETAHLWPLSPPN